MTVPPYLQRDFTVELWISYLPGLLHFSSSSVKTSPFCGPGFYLGVKIDSLDIWLHSGLRRTSVSRPTAGMNFETGRQKPAA